MSGRARVVPDSLIDSEVLEKAACDVGGWPQEVAPVPTHSTEGHRFVEVTSGKDKWFPTEEDAVEAWVAAVKERFGHIGSGRLVWRIRPEMFRHGSRHAVYSRLVVIPGPTPP